MNESWCWKMTVSWCWKMTGIPAWRGDIRVPHCCQSTCNGGRRRGRRTPSFPHAGRRDEGYVERIRESMARTDKTLHAAGLRCGGGRAVAPPPPPSRVCPIEFDPMGEDGSKPEGLAAFLIAGVSSEEDGIWLDLPRLFWRTLQTDGAEGLAPQGIQVVPSAQYGFETAPTWKLRRRRQQRRKRRKDPLRLARRRARPKSASRL